jgi:tRNA(fMet)-specific endonuclease VapC
MFLLDTNIISDMVRHPQGAAMSRLQAVGDGAVATSVIVAGELRYGCLKRGSPRLTERVEAVLREIAVIGVDPTIAQAYGAIRAELEAIGQPIGQNDLWIAAQARTLGMALVTDNEREFRRVPGLAVENWLGA